jgi:hypothetical protein
MFTLEFDRIHNVLLTRFSGMILPDDIRSLDQAARLFLRDHGPVRRLLDFSDVSTVAIPESFLSSPSALTQISLGQAGVFVVSQEELLELVRRYARQQREYGNPEPAIVRTIAEAYAVLNIATPHFAPVPRFGSG